MSRILANLESPTGNLISNTAEIVYTAPASAPMVLVKGLRAHNTHSGDVVLTISVVPAGETLSDLHMISKATIGTNASTQMLGTGQDLALAPGDRLYAVADVADKIALHTSLQVFESVSGDYANDASSLRYDSSRTLKGAALVPITTAEVVYTAVAPVEVLRQVYGFNDSADTACVVTLSRQLASESGAPTAAQRLEVESIAFQTVEPLLDGDIVLAAGDKIIAVGSVDDVVSLNFRVDRYLRSFNSIA